MDGQPLGCRLVGRRSDSLRAGLAREKGGCPNLSRPVEELAPVRQGAIQLEGAVDGAQAVRGVVPRLHAPPQRSGQRKAPLRHYVHKVEQMRTRRLHRGWLRRPSAQRQPPPPSATLLPLN